MGALKSGVTIDDGSSCGQASKVDAVVSEVPSTVSGAVGGSREATAEGAGTARPVGRLGMC